MSDVTEQAKRRRTFTRCRRPSQSQRTLTKKFLLYGGALCAERSERWSRQSRRLGHVDWMALEQQHSM